MNYFAKNDRQFHLNLIGNREIGHSTIIRVLSIILLSILIITAGFFCLLVFEQGKNPVHLLFESVSAFCTVGLSLADTSDTSEYLNPDRHS